MALTKASLSTKIQTEIIALYGAAQNSAKLKDFADAIAKAVVDEITQNAVVTTSVPNIQAGASTGVGTGTVA